jgi:hypothetical protein
MLYLSGCVAGEKTIKIMWKQAIGIFTVRRCSDETMYGCG